MVAFSKYHGCGNNFVVLREVELAEHLGVPCGEESVEAYMKFTRNVCSESIGVGADGLIAVREKPELEMVFFNRDGSRAPMCGNGIRCFAAYCSDRDIRTEESYKVKTLAGDMVVHITERDPFRVKIDMGSPMFSPKAINVKYDGENFLNQRLLLVDEKEVEIDSLFMGTIHTVIFTDDVEASSVEKTGEEICNHPVFREKTNVNFVKVIDDNTLQMITYERGVGMTLACGTGACASVVVANLKGLCRKSADVKLPLGSLTIELKDNGHVYMEGPAVRILEGELF